MAKNINIITDPEDFDEVHLEIANLLRNVPGKVKLLMLKI